MSERSSITRLIDQIRDGNTTEVARAAAVLWSRYFSKLLAVAENHLSPRVRRRVDGEDVLQDAYHAFLVRHRRGEFDLANRDELWALLRQITVNKARKAAAREQALKRDVRRERPEPAGAGAEELPDWLNEQGDNSPTPDDAVATAEEMGLLLNRLDAQLREVANFKLGGDTNEEIAAKLGCVVRTVERKVERIRQLWERADGEG